MHDCWSRAADARMRPAGRAHHPGLPARRGLAAELSRLPARGLPPRAPHRAAAARVQGRAACRPCMAARPAGRVHRGRAGPRRVDPRRHPRLRRRRRGRAQRPAGHRHRGDGGLCLRHHRAPQPAGLLRHGARAGRHQRRRWRCWRPTRSRSRCGLPDAAFSYLRSHGTLDQRAHRALRAADGPDRRPAATRPTSSTRRAPSSGCMATCSAACRCRRRERPAPGWRHEGRRRTRAADRRHAAASARRWPRALSGGRRRPDAGGPLAGAPAAQARALEQRCAGRARVDWHERRPAARRRPSTCAGQAGARPGAASLVHGAGVPASAACETLSAADDVRACWTPTCWRRCC